MITKDEFFGYITGKLNDLQVKENQLQSQLEEAKKEFLETKKALKCNHDICEKSYSDYYGKIVTIACKKCGFSIEF